MGQLCFGCFGLACTCRQHSAGDCVGSGKRKNSLLWMRSGEFRTSLITRLIWSFPFLRLCALTYLFSDPGLPSGNRGGDNHSYHLLLHLRMLPGHFTYIISFTSHTNPLKKVLLVLFYRWKNLRHREFKLLLFKVTQLQNQDLNPGLYPALGPMDPTLSSRKKKK